MTEPFYHLVQQEERIGSLSLTMIGIRNFDEAVDDLFRALDARGEGEQLNELCPFFAKVWPAARGLARFLATSCALGPETRVLEVGCGLALPGIVAAQLGAKVTVSDFHPEVPGFLKRNLGANEIAPVTYRHADWRDPATDLGIFDLVMGSDILYDRAHAADLLRFVSHHLAPGGRVIVADPGRAYLQDFTSLIEATGFTATVETDRVVDGEGTKDVFVVDYRRALLRTVDLADALH